MAYTLEEAKTLIIRAGKELLAKGLVARTWGNISARISDTHFAITPSGRSYETLTLDQIVVVAIDDLSYKGTIKPSSEKGIHADCYRLRKDVQFIIHTHQKAATVLSVSGEHFTVEEANLVSLLGNTIPCAPYGISSTKKLRQNVAETVEKFSQSKAFLMQSHGALCLGTSYEKAFVLAEALEKAMQKRIYKTIGVATDADMITKYFHNRRVILATSALPDLGTSIRFHEYFLLKQNGVQNEYLVRDKLPPEAWIARMHQALYRTQKIHSIVYENDPFVVAFSAIKKTLHPSIDDLAQIGGATIKTATSSRVSSKLKGRNAVFVLGLGALCTGRTMDDAQAVAMILRKGCEAEVVSTLLDKPHRLSFFDAWIQRTVYVSKYSKMKNKR